MGSGTDRRSELTRRTVVRTAANAAWVAPAVLVATAAPAFATLSGTPAVLAIPVFLAAYENQGDPATVRADLLVVNATITNTGGAPAPQTSFEVKIPTGSYPLDGSVLHYVEPQVAATPGWTSVVALIEGDPTYRWSITYTFAAQIPPGGSAVLTNAVIRFWDQNFPFKAWAGTPFTIAGIATDPAAVGGPVSASAAVADSTAGALTIGTFQASRVLQSGTMELHLGFSGPVAVNTSRKTCGPVTVTFDVPIDPNHRYYSAYVVPSDHSNAPAWTEPVVSQTDNVWHFSLTSIPGSKSALAPQGLTLPMDTVTFGLSRLALWLLPVGPGASIAPHTITATVTAAGVGSASTTDMDS